MKDVNFWNRKKRKEGKYFFFFLGGLLVDRGSCSREHVVSMKKVKNVKLRGQSHFNQI